MSALLLLIMAAAQAASTPPLVRTDPGPPPPPPVISIPAAEPPRLKERPAQALFERAVPPRARLPLPTLFTPNDYPQAARQAGREGTTAVVLSINPQGMVDGCFIESSAGDEQLDATTCRLLRSRARFEPARDAKGSAVASAMSARIRWQLPPNARIPITAWRAEITATVAPDGRLLSCSEVMEGIARPPHPGCRNFGANVPVGAVVNKEAGPSRLRFEARMEPRAMEVSDLPKLEGELLYRVAARLRIGTDGQMTGCDIIELGGLMMFANPRPLDCRTVFRGLYGKPQSPTEVTTVVSTTRLK